MLLKQLCTFRQVCVYVGFDARKCIDDISKSLTAEGEWYLFMHAQSETSLTNTDEYR